MPIEFHNLILWKIWSFSVCKIFIITSSKLILPFKSDPPSQQQTAALLILLQQYSKNDIIHIVLKMKYLFLCTL